MSTKSLLKFKSNRFLAQNIWPTRKISIKQKKILTKLKKKKLSNFGANFFAKRFLSILYGNLSSNQMEKAFEKAKLMKGKIGNNFLFFLEKRLDTVLFRMNICRTFGEAQQLINHQKVFVNGNSISIASYQIKSGDIINLSPDSDIQFLSIVKRIANGLKKNALCATKTLHLEVNFVSLSAIFLYPPQQLIYPAKFEIPKIEK